MNQPLPDEVPVEDAIEAAEEQVLPDDSPVPLESDEADWQEQRIVVEDPEEDFR